MGMSWASGTPDDEQSRRVIARALNEGASMLDAADMYGPFTNEELIGDAIRGRRNEAFVATKCGFSVMDRNTFELELDGSPAHIGLVCEESLQRLRTEVI